MMSEENIFNADETQDTTVAETGSEDVQTTEDGGSELYIYDTEDDEPVKDRDLYHDYTGEPLAVPAPIMPKKGTGSAENVKSQMPEQADEPERESVSEPAAGSAESTYERTENNPESDHSDYAEDDDDESTAPVSPQIRINRIYTVNTVISMITLCIVAAGIFTGYAYMKRLEQDLGIAKRHISDLEDKETVSEEEEVVDAISIIGEEEKEEASVPLTDNIDIDRGKVLIYDNYVGYGWVPVLSGVRQNTYKSTDFQVDDRYRMTYTPEGEESSYFGIDVSSYQGEIDWDAVRSDGVEFAILRIGVRGYGEEGNIKLDDYFFDNYEKAHKAGIDVGVYFFSQAISPEEAQEEAKFVLEQLDGRKLEYPVVFDWEPATVTDPEDVPRTEDVMPGTLTLSAISFCETIRDAGYDSMIYLGKKLAYIKYDLRQLGDYPVWLALYSTDLSYIYDFDIWQYGSGEVDGIEGDVDYNIAIIR